MPGNRPSSFNYFLNNQFVRLINAVYIKIEIIIYNITGSSNKNRRKHQQGKMKMIKVRLSVSGGQQRVDNTIHEKKLCYGYKRHGRY